MATYNGERYIREQLDSFVAQTRRPDELVITDDGSTDETLSIVRDFAASAPFPVRLSQNAHRLHYARNFERAISLCSGDIIFLSDQDDVWFPEKIATLAGYLERYPESSVVINDQVLTNARLENSGVTKLGNLKRAGKCSDGLIEGCCTAFRRNWGRLLFPMARSLDNLVATQDLSHDRWLNELAIALNVRGVVEQPLQYFRRTGSNVTSWVLSEPKPIRMTDLAKQRRPVAPRENWLRRVEVLDAYVQYIHSHGGLLPGNVNGALARLEHNRTSITQRAELSVMWIGPRLAAIWRMWRSGGYRYFEGWLSAVSDLLRST